MIFCQQVSILSMFYTLVFRTKFWRQKNTSAFRSFSSTFWQKKALLYKKRPRKMLMNWLKGWKNFYRFVGSGKCWRDHLSTPQRVEKPGPLMSRETEDTCPRPKVSFNNNSKKFPKSLAVLLILKNYFQLLNGLAF
jgi:hypothetical protein